VFEGGEKVGGDLDFLVGGFGATPIMLPDGFRSGSELCGRRF